MYAFECFTNFWTRLERSKLVEVRYGEIWDGGVFSLQNFSSRISWRMFFQTCPRATPTSWKARLVTMVTMVMNRERNVGFWHLADLARSVIGSIHFLFSHIRAYSCAALCECFWNHVFFVHFFAGLVDVFRTAIMQSTGPAEAHADERRWAARWDYEPLRCEMDARHGCTFFLGPDLCALHHSQFCIVFFSSWFFPFTVEQCEFRLFHQVHYKPQKVFAMQVLHPWSHSMEGWARSVTCDFRGKQHARCLTHVFLPFPCRWTSAVWRNVFKKRKMQKWKQLEERWILVVTAFAALMLFWWVCMLHE